MKLPRLQRFPNFEEVHTYVVDLMEITELRDKTAEDPELKDELERYDTIIECMQLVMIQLNSTK